MKSQTTGQSNKPLYLSKEEALALLEVCLFTDAEDAPAKSEAMSKLGDLCREFIRADDINNQTVSSKEYKSLEKMATERIVRQPALRRSIRSTICA